MNLRAVRREALQSDDPGERRRAGVDVLRELDAYHCVLVDGAFPGGTARRMHDLLERLFALPLEEKLRYPSSGTMQPGFAPMGHARALDTGIPNLLETWLVPEERQDLWPSAMVEEWRTTLSFKRALRRVAVDVLRALETALGCRPEELVAPLHETGFLRFYHYPPVSGPPLDGARRQSKHCDMSVVTLLPAASARGLEICDARGLWHPIDVGEEQCLVQTGHLLTRMTGDRLPACLHTVEIYPEDAGSIRYSTPFFLPTAPEAIISVLPPFQAEAGHRYPPATAAEISRDYFSRIFGNVAR